MAAAKKGKTADGYWEKRLRSNDFKRRVAAAIEGELIDLAERPLREVVDAKRVRDALARLDLQSVDERILVDLAVVLGERFENRMRRTGESFSDLLGTDLADATRAFLDENILLSGSTERFIVETLKQEFVQNLLVDLIHTAIVSFYKRVNPIFGGITTAVLEDQIRGFIRLFLPILQQQAISFATRKTNQRVLLDLTRSMARQVLEEPVANFTLPVSPSQQQKIRALVRKAVESPHVEALVRQALVTAWDDFYRAVRRKKVRDIVDLETHAPSLAHRGVEILAPVLARPSVVRLIARETAVSGGRS